METVGKLDPAGVAELAETLSTSVKSAVKVSDDVLRDVLVALFAEGHVLIEDHPGVGKTALARALARSIDAEYARVQCTADLLPSDVVGTNFYNQREARFEFHPGPVFANIVLVDEINRTSPKTQSGLLECMQERRVTVDGQPHPLARPFVVLATQNPAEYEGTYPLPEAQLDRFMVRVSLGYPGADAEAAMLDEHAGGDRVLEVAPVAETATIRSAQLGAAAVHGSEALRGYVVSICEATRRDPADRARRQPPRRPDAVPRRQGTGRDRGPRPRAPGPRQGAGRSRPLASHRARHRDGTRRGARGGRRDGRAAAGAMNSRRAAGAGALGLGLLAAGLLLGIAALLVPAIGLIGLTILGGAWVWISARTTTLERARGAARIVEGDEYPLRISIGRRIPIAGGELHRSGARSGRCRSGRGGRSRSPPRSASRGAAVTVSIPRAWRCAIRSASGGSS